MADINEKTLQSTMLSNENDGEDNDIMQLKNQLGGLGFNISDISPTDLEKICYENTPEESRTELLQGVMFIIHPEKEFWIVKNEAELISNLRQVSSWFGLPKDEILMGGGSRSDQKFFWQALLEIATMLSNAENSPCVPLDIGLMKNLDYIILNSTILDECISSHKGAEFSGDNGGVNPVKLLIEKIESETRELEKHLDRKGKDPETVTGIMSSRTLKRKHKLSNSLKSVQNNLSAMLDKYKVFCPVSHTKMEIDNTNKDEPQTDIEQMKIAFEKIISIQARLNTFSLI